MPNVCDVEEGNCKNVCISEEPGVGGIMRSTSPEMLEMLASLGTSGRNPQHCHAELQTRLGHSFGHMAVMTFKCPMLSLKRREGEQLHTMADHGIVLPFEFFSMLYGSYPESFAKRFLGGNGATIARAPEMLRRFWAQVPDGDPRKVVIARELMKRPDINRVEDIWDRAIPISFHGDGFPLTRTIRVVNACINVFAIVLRIVGQASIASRGAAPSWSLA